MKEPTLLGVELTTDLLNERLEGYRVLREVGHGAMGIVFEARQRGLDRRVAVKVLPPNLSTRDRTVRRFLREAEAMGRLAHTNIVDVYEVGSLGTLHFFAMRFVDGPPLDVVLKAGVLGVGDVIQVGIDVAGALAHAHARGVLHRDVKPSNLLRDGERVVLTDFGLAKPIDSDDEDAMTESGDLVGTPLYMSPEQIQGEKGGIDARSDVWGLGATLYELLIGRPPFSGGSAQAILNSILHKDPVLPRRLRADVPRDLEAVLLKCLEKDRARRYSGAAGLHADLLAIQGGRSVSARPPRFFDPAARWSRRHPLQAAGVTLGLVAFGFFAAQMRTSTLNLATKTQEVKTAVDQKTQALEQKQQALVGKSEAIARYELSKALGDFQNAQRRGGGGQERDRAFERISFLANAIEFETYPRLATDIWRVFASCAHELGLDARVQAGFDEAYGKSSSKTALALQGAMLEGMDRLDEALIVHLRRTRLFPKSSDTCVDAASVLRQRALRERGLEQGDRARR
ncbi:MAG TPA: serine/threonine-protein kinase, partial [Planctomycetota bacterium]|nr:serine/threonine-protein kinase [Planctomycetota bacterium]